MSFPSTPTYRAISNLLAVSWYRALQSFSTNGFATTVDNHFSLRYTNWTALDRAFSGTTKQTPAGYVQLRRYGFGSKGSQNLLQPFPLYPSPTTTHHAFIPPEPQTQPSATNYTPDTPPAPRYPPSPVHPPTRLPQSETPSHLHTDTPSSTLRPPPSPPPYS